MTQSGPRQGWRRAVEGFSLIESVVAMTIVGIAFSSVLMLQARLSDQMVSMERAAERTVWRYNVTEIASALNHTDIKGPLQLAAFQVEWRPGPSAVVEKPNRINIREIGPSILSIGDMAFTVRRGQDTILEASQLVVRARPDPATLSENPSPIR